MALAGPEAEYSGDGPVLTSVPDTKLDSVTRTIGPARTSAAILNRFQAPLGESTSAFQGVTAEALLAPDDDERAAAISRVLGAAAAEITSILRPDTK